jgi:hypothetical protein
MCLEEISLSSEYSRVLSGLLAQVFHVVTTDDESMRAVRLCCRFDQVEL